MRESVAGADEPFSVAVTVAIWSETRLPALTVKVAEVVLAGTVTEDGTAKADEALLASATTALLVDVVDRVTVQVAFVLEARAAGEHWSEEIAGGITVETGPVTVNSSMISSQA